MSSIPLRHVDFVTRWRWRWFHYTPIRNLKEANRTYNSVSMHRCEWGQVNSMLERRYLKNVAQKLLANHIQFLARLSPKQRYLVKVKLDPFTHHCIWAGVYRYPKERKLVHRGSIYNEGAMEVYLMVDNGSIDVIPYLSSHTAVQDLHLCAQYSIALP